MFDIFCQNKVGISNQWTLFAALSSFLHDYFASFSANSLQIEMFWRKILPGVAFLGKTKQTKILDRYLQYNNSHLQK